MTLIRSLSRTGAALMLGLAALGLLAMTAIIGWQVYGRYVLGTSPSWTEQAALTLMIWFVCLAGAAGVREGFHIRITAFVEALPNVLRRPAGVLAELAVIGCGLAMAVFGAELVARTWAHVIPSLGLPRGVAYLGLPICGGLIVLFGVERLLLGPAPAEDAAWN